MSDSVSKWHEMQEEKNAKIFESPDGGKTVYERPFGGDISERTLVRSTPQVSQDTKQSAYRLLTEYDTEVIRYANKILDLGGE